MGHTEKEWLLEKRIEKWFSLIFPTVSWPKNRLSWTEIGLSWPKNRLSWVEKSTFVGQKVRLFYL